MNDFFKGMICLASNKLYVKMKFHQVVNNNTKILLITSLYNAMSIHMIHLFGIYLAKMQRFTLRDVKEQLPFF